jgi:hypothetical protein
MELGGEGMSSTARPIWKGDTFSVDQAIELMEEGYFVHCLAYPDFHLMRREDGVAMYNMRTGRLSTTSGRWILNIGHGLPWAVVAPAGLQPKPPIWKRISKAVTNWVRQG